MSSAVITSALPVFEALRLIANSDVPLSTADVSRMMKLPTSTVHRFLGTLEQTGYIARYAGSPRFIPGNMPLHLCRALFNRFPLSRLGHPYLRQLAKVSHETVTLVVRVGRFSLQIEAIGDTAHVLDITGPGALSPLHETLEGRTILAFASESDIQDYRAQLQSRTTGSSKTGRGFWLEQKETRARGYATASLTFSENLTALALPIRNRFGIAVAAFGILGPVLDSRAKRLAPHIRELLNIRNGLESALGECADDSLDPFAHWRLDAATAAGRGRGSQRSGTKQRSSARAIRLTSPRTKRKYGDPA